MEKKINPGESDRRRSLAPRNARGATSATGRSNDADRRGRSERRVVYDRRQLIRFEDDRRAAMERRVGLDPWAFP